MIYRIFAIISLLCCFAFVLPQEEPDSEPLIKWMSFHEMMKVNEENPKKVILDVYTDWCGWCKRMENSTYQDIAIAEYINEHFYPVKFDAESKGLIELYGQQYKYHVPRKGRGYHELALIFTRGQLTYPTTVFLDSDLTSIKTFPGYHNTVDMEKVLHFINDGYYKKVSYKQFAETFVSKVN